MLEAAYWYALANRAMFVEALSTQMRLSLLAFAIGAVLSIPLGLYIARRRPLSRELLGLLSALRVIPSLAILFLAVPYLGLGFLPALVALARVPRKTIIRSTTSRGTFGLQ